MPDTYSFRSHIWFPDGHWLCVRLVYYLKESYAHMCHKYKSVSVFCVSKFDGDAPDNHIPHKKIQYLCVVKSNVSLGNIGILPCIHSD